MDNLIKCDVIEPEVSFTLVLFMPAYCYSRVSQVWHSNYVIATIDIDDLASDT